MKLYPIASNEVHTLKLQHKLLQGTEACTPIQDSILNKNTAKMLAAYNIINSGKNVAFGSKLTIVKQGADELMLQITDMAHKAASVCIETDSKAKNAEPVRSFLTSTRREPDGLFHIPLLAIDRATNEFLEKITTGKATFYDANGKLLKQSATALSYSPKTEFSQTSLKKLLLNGNESYQDFDVISNASTTGVLKLFDDYESIKRYGRKKGEENPVLALLNSSDAENGLIMDTMQDDFSLPSKVVGIIMRKRKGTGNIFLSCLSHAKCRMDGKQAFVALSDDVMDSLKKTYVNTGKNKVQFVAYPGLLEVKELQSLAKTNVKVTLDPIKMADGLLTPKGVDFGIESIETASVLHPNRTFVPEAVGVKGYNLGKLKAICEKIGFNVPDFFSIPPGEVNKILKHNDNLFGKKGDFTKLIKLADKSYKAGGEYEPILAQARNLIYTKMEFPPSFMKRVNSTMESVMGTKLPETYDKTKKLGQDDFVVSIRSSFPNIEDIDKVASQGMFSSYIGARSQDELKTGMKKVIASWFSDIAYKSRMEHSIPHYAVRPALVVQTCEKGFDYSGIMYTRKIAEPEKLFIDLSQGDCTTMQGNPYNFEYNRSTGESVRTLLATKGRKKCVEHIDPNDKANTKYTMTDYSKDPLNLSHEQYAPIVRRMAEIGLGIEKEFSGKPQDLEFGVKFIRDKNGTVIGEKLTVWQTRNVQMPKED